jgi:hypothetical protein
VPFVDPGSLLLDTDRGGRASLRAWSRRSRTLSPVLGKRVGTPTTGGETIETHIATVRTTHCKLCLTQSLEAVKA